MGGPSSSLAKPASAQAYDVIRRRTLAATVVKARHRLVLHYNPLGSVHGGIAATLLDSVMGCCIHTTLKAGTGYTTVEIKVNYIRAMTDKTGQVRAEGKVINVGARIATSEGRLVDAAGKLLAHGTTTCLVFPI